mmetsp:Transcript_10112/g.9970  ORF Transcript_10112/g.9970 Transcript_10112/m.9970 type:complete len:194 (-) Transcript_10112:17-598(-)
MYPNNAKQQKVEMKTSRNFLNNEEERLETLDRLDNHKPMRVLPKKNPRTEILYDLPPEDENPPEYPIIKDPKKATIGVNTDVSSPSIFMKQYKINEGTDVKIIKPMLIDSSIVDSIKNENDQQLNKNAYQEFTRRVNNYRKDPTEEDSNEDSDEPEGDTPQNNFYYEETRNFYHKPKESKKTGDQGKIIRMLN